MFEALLKIVPLAADAFQWLLSRNEKEREQFGSLCDRIGELLQSFAKASDDERLSRNLCGELKVYVPAIKAMAAPILEKNQLTEMAQALSNVCDAWSRHSENIGKRSYATSDLREIDTAGGHFRGLARLVRGM